MTTDSKPAFDNNQAEMRKYDGMTTLPVRVSYCLGSCQECTGFYSDDSGKFLLKCACTCHEILGNVKT